MMVGPITDRLVMSLPSRTMVSTLGPEARKAGVVGPDYGTLVLHCYGRKAGDRLSEGASSKGEHENRDRGSGYVEFKAMMLLL